MSPTSYRLLFSTVREIGQRQSDFLDLMQITRATDYGVRILIYLAAAPEGERVAASEVARGIEAPESFVSKVLQQLVQRGMVTSRRGAGGGFQLAIEPEKVTLLDVVEIVEGPLQINLCLAGENGCDRKPRCGAHPIWSEAQDALKEVLANASIAQLARDSMTNRANTTESNNGNKLESVRIVPAEPVRPKRRSG